MRRATTAFGIAPPSHTALGSCLLGNRLRVLAYHRIANEPRDPLAVPPQRFAEQLAYLRDAGFEVLALGEALRRLRDREPLRRIVVITFDDGYADMLTEAAPLLEQCRFSATVFVVTGRLGQLSDWHRVSPSSMLLGAADIQLLHSRGFGIGSHSASHAYLPDLPPEQLSFEIRESRRTLEQLGIADICFAYPYGANGPREREAVRLAGYQHAFAIGGAWGNGYHTDRFALHRAEVHGHHTLAHFRALVHGAYSLPGRFGALPYSRGAR